MDIEQANTTAVNRLMEARPILKAVATARDVMPGMKDNLFLHAGPPIEEPKGVLFVPQRRKALALWLTSPENR